MVIKHSSWPALALFPPKPCEDTGDDDDFGGYPRLPADVHDHRVIYCQLFAPAFVSPDLSFGVGQVPVATGALVTRFLRCPSDISQPNMLK